MSAVEYLRQNLAVVVGIPAVLVGLIVEYLLSNFQHFLLDYVSYDTEVKISVFHYSSVYTIALQRHEISGLWVSITELATILYIDNNTLETTITKKVRTFDTARYMIIYEIDMSPEP